MGAQSIDNDPAAVAAAWKRAYAPERNDATPPDVQGTDRASSDALAAWIKWQASASFQATSANEHAWHQVFERARVEALASAELPGIAENLLDLDGICPPHPAAEHVYRAARSLFAGFVVEGILPNVPLPQQAHTAGPNIGWIGRLKGRFRQAAKEAPRATFAVATDAPTAEPLTEQAALDCLRAASLQIAEPTQYVESISPLIRQLAQRAPIVAQDTSQEAATTDISDMADDSSQETEDAEAETSEIVKPGSPEFAAAKAVWNGYTVFSRKWDEVRSSASFFAAGQLANLEALSGPRRDDVKRLAHRLQRRLLASQLRSWSFDQEQGRIDSRRLARLLTPDSRAAAVFRQEDEAPVPNASVTLLVDQSGSMDAKRREMAAMVIDLTVHTLERCGISTEVLGFTTRYGVDSPLLAEWREAGSPPLPGRLNALRHIVYKPANKPWRRCRPYLALFLNPKSGHENIDGEALDWAARRLATRGEPRKILIVLSDGSPYDAATGQAHDRSYLENHLREVISAVESSAIQLVGVGAAQNVSRFYRNALALRRPEDIAAVLFEELAALLTKPAHLGHPGKRNGASQ